MNKIKRFIKLLFSDLQVLFAIIAAIFALYFAFNEQAFQSFMFLISNVFLLNDAKRAKDIKSRDRIYYEMIRLIYKLAGMKKND